jgi:hypothetical protein
LRILLSVHRRSSTRIGIDLRTSPPRAGRLRLSLAFSHHAARSHTLTLRHGRATIVARVPPGTTALKLAVDGLGARATRRLELAPPTGGRT